MRPRGPRAQPPAWRPARRRSPGRGTSLSADRSSPVLRGRSPAHGAQACPLLLEILRVGFEVLQHFQEPFGVLGRLLRLRLILLVFLVFVLLLLLVLLVLVLLVFLVLVVLLVFVLLVFLVLVVLLVLVLVLVLLLVL